MAAEPGRRGPRVFFLGYPQAGGDIAVRLFRRNGVAAMGGLNGKIAENILYARHAGAAPLRPWKDTLVFADMECAGHLGKPVLRGFGEHGFLRDSFPGALFVLNIRDEARWLAARAKAFAGGREAVLAGQLGVAPRDLPGLWVAEMRAHLAAVRAAFADHERFFEWDAWRDGAAALRDWVAPWYDLPLSPRERDEDAAAEDAALAALRGMRSVPRARVARDAAFEDGVVAHAMGREGPGRDDAAAASLVYGDWDGAGTVRNAAGRPLPVVRAALEGGEAFLGNGARFKLDRVLGVLNEVLGLGRALPLRVDMEDARKYGMAGEANPAWPLLTYCRRAGARNVVLWPLPVYHAIGNRFFAQPAPVDPVAFGDKADAAGWRGKLAGRSGFHEGAADGRSARQILDDLAAGNGREAEIAGELEGVVRYRVLRRLAGHRDFDMQFTLLPQHEALAGHPLLAGLCGARRPPEWFYRYRYLPCLSGYDTGSNFFLAANSNSVVLKEEDGWELFYTSSFRAWEHYVPLARGAADLEDKLAWARANPARCREMVRASQAICARFADPEARARILNRVLDGVAERQGPASV